MSDVTGASLPPVDASLLPADVRGGSAERKEQYRAALAFERVLIGQLTEKMFKPGASEEGGSAAVEIRRQQLPGVLADAMIATGGLGLAKQLDASWSAGRPPVTTPLSTPLSTPGDGEVPA